MAIRKVVSRSIGTDVIVAEDLANNSVTAAEITDGAVTTNKLGNGAVTTDKIADGNVTSAKLDTNIDIAGTLDVTGATTLDSTLDVNSILTVSAAGNNTYGGLDIANTGTYGSQMTIRNLDDTTGGSFFAVSTTSGWTYGTEHVIMGYGNPSSSNVGLAFDSQSRVELPKQPAFYANGTPSKDGDNDLYAYTNVRFNTGSHYNNSTGKFTCPKSGKYFISAGVRVQGDTWGEMFIIFNDTNDDIGAEVSIEDNFGSANLAAIYDLDANDTINVRFTAAIAGSTPRNHFSVYFLG